MGWSPLYSPRQGGIYSDYVFHRRNSKDQLVTEEGVLPDGVLRTDEGPPVDVGRGISSSSGGGGSTSLFPPLGGGFPPGGAGSANLGGVGGGHTPKVKFAPMLEDQRPHPQRVIEDSELLQVERGFLPEF